MLFRYLKIFIHFHTSNYIKQNSIWLYRMSSEAVPDSVKRKAENTTEDEITVTKKLKEDEDHVEEQSEAIQKLVENTNRFRKPKKAVLLLSYLGKEFYGMQRNSNVTTVEELLLKALLDCNVILKTEFEFPKTMKFQRAARTDKGVSAVRQIVSLKLPVKEISESLPEKVNTYLPPDIRVIGVRRVTQSFDAKIACDSRTYSYMLPTFAFELNIEENAELYRISESKIKEVNNFLQNFMGTHNFYNFTSGRLPGDPSCRRYIMSIECGPPFESCGLEFSVIKIKGQSFMLHQIRKMIGLTIAFMRNLADISVLHKSWSIERIDIPKAPALGLMLEEPHYDWYNTKYGSDGVHQPLKWDEYEEIIEAFKKEKICSNIAQTERDEKSMIQWLETLPYHSYDIREAGPPAKLPTKENELKEATNNQSTASEIASSEVESSLSTQKLLCNSNETQELCKSKENEIKCEC